MASSSKSIFIIEDDLDIREALSELLALEGFRTRAAQNGREALDLLKSLAPDELPDLIILDLMMPIMDGASFRRAQLSEPGLKEIPVAILSADGQIQEKSKSLSPVGVIKKPVELDSFLRKVQRYLGGKAD